MLMELLKKGGSANTADIAKALLIRDISQIEYYETITKNMVGRVLTKNRGITEKQNDSYHINGFDSLSVGEVKILIDLCDSKIESYVERRGDRIWSHRKKSSGYISGTTRYEVLKRAKYRCELCGVSAEIKAIEVDHIVPRNLGGSDDISNFQSLCYSCNSTKRDRDDADFRGITQSYQQRESGCVFCETDKLEVQSSNELCYSINDKYPVTKLHSLIIPKRHVQDFFDLYQPEINAIHTLLNLTKKEIKNSDKTVTGFNIGVNSGVDAGQTIFHCHIHLIPRRKGDNPNPRAALPVGGSFS
jgi:diadenosine tetraphosphate (Ap4A) HIT family hydrolase/5-methylcytosine-specific restriction endonuclease McrA